MNKVRYEIDPYNRFVVIAQGDDTSLPEFRKVVDGSFKLDDKNELSYHVKSPDLEDEYIPRQIKIKGNWSLTDDHRLRITLDSSARESFGDQITLEGEILDVNKNSLLFAVTTVTKSGIQSTYVLNLDGTWHTDKNNRISFHVRKESGKYDILLFNGVWEVGENYQITYQYEKASLVRKKRESHTLIFKGYWKIKDSFGISYIFSKSTDSSFDFKTSACAFADNYIRYELGVGLSGATLPTKQIVTLFGKWNINKSSGLTFDIEYKDGVIDKIVFAAEAKLTANDAISFRLKDSIDDKDIGVTIELSHKILGNDGEAFLRLLKSNRESAVYLGAGGRW